MLAAAGSTCMRVRAEAHELQAWETRAGADRDACGRARVRETEWHEPSREAGVGVRASAVSCLRGGAGRRSRRLTGT